jgi:hypothetical protein
MKGEAEPLIERAVLQARQEADLLYNLVINANVAVIENGVQREREYILLLGVIGAEWRGKTTEQSIEVRAELFQGHIMQDGQADHRFGFRANHAAVRRLAFSSWAVVIRCFMAFNRSSSVSRPPAAMLAHV